MRPREKREGFAEPLDVCRKVPVVFPELEDEPAIHRILACRSEMHEAPGARVVGADERSERGDERNGGIPCLLRPVGELGEVEELRAALPPDALRRLRRNQPDSRLGPSQRRFEIEHPLQPCAVAEAPLGRRCPEQLAQQLGGGRSAHRCREWQINRVRASYDPIGNPT